MTGETPQPWRIRSSEITADCRIFKVRKDTTVNPRTGVVHEMYSLDNPTWVNIIPLTTDDHVVLVEQWRHGTASIHVETPGGLVDEGESPLACAGRELREETGFEAKQLVEIGVVHANPAFQSNQLHYVLATGCHKVGEPSLDHAEDIHVRLVALADIPGMIQRQEITHALVIAAFYLLDLHRGRHG